MKVSVSPPPSEPDWAHLLEAEARLEAEIAAEEAAARARITAARAAAAAEVPDPSALAALSTRREQAAIEQQRTELARIDAELAAAVRALAEAPDPLIESLARAALDALLTDTLPTGPR